MPPGEFRRLAVLALIATLLALSAAGVPQEAASFAVTTGQLVSKSGSGEVRFRAAATKRGGWGAEWADLSCASESRVKRVKRRVAQGRRAYRMRVNEGDDRYGERCELGMANTGVRTSTAWAARACCSTTAPSRGSRRRSCSTATRTPSAEPNAGSTTTAGWCSSSSRPAHAERRRTASSIRNLPGVGVVLEHRNSAENDCGNAPMKSLWRVPIRRGRWIQILQHVRWSTDPDTGYIATWINGRPVQPSLDGNSKRVERTGDEVRIHTWTLKDGPEVDHLAHVRRTRARTCATACTATRACTATASCTCTAPRLRRRARWRRQARDSGEPGPSIPRLSFRYRVFAACARCSAPLAGV